MHSNTSLVPNQAIHPGLHLKEALLQKGIKQNEIAAETGIQASQLNEILKGKRSITPDFAILLGAVLNMDPEFWNNLQAQYNLDIAKIEKNVQEKVEAINNWKLIKPLIPVSYFRKRQVLSGELKEDVPTILKVLGFHSPIELQKELSSKSLGGVHFKKSSKLLEYTSYVNSWIRYVKFLSTNVKVEEFDFSSQELLLKELKKLFLKQNVLENLHKLMSKYGIKLVICEKPDHVPLDGAAFWYESSPILALTLRHHRYDNLIFTVYHEVAHIFLHLKNNKEISFVDSLEDSKMDISQTEEEANDFARNSMISKTDWKEFTFGKSNFTDVDITSFAAEQQVPPPSVWGRLCFEGRVKYSTPSIFQRQNQIP
ncbi:HigA family addiction module antitoxin [Runella zeae]|uniref:HigA family addiction module antitoxin n=1 Tax=Runella zeae TaxID=94255 RepID=UPI00040B84A4|nr:HigA family addiction module antitoxin [Runella zeae]